MKNLSVCLAMCTFGLGFSQVDLSAIFTAGVEDAEVFANNYLAPVSESVAYGISSAWYNTAESKEWGGFEISVIGSLTGFKNKKDKKVFILDPNEYQYLDFVEEPGTAKAVSTGLGDLQGVRVFVEGSVEGVPVRSEFELPSGLSAENLNFVPSGYLQASVAIFEGTELKARLLPKVAFEDVSLGLFGFGIQQDFTKLLPPEEALPVAISAVIGYTNLNGDYDFTEETLVQGENQRLDLQMETWAFHAVVSTRLPVINLYGALGYLTATSETKVLGTYRVTQGPFASQSYTDPFTITKKVGGVTANIGAKLKLGFFRLNADYTLGAFNTLTVGINFGFR